MSVGSALLFGNSPLIGDIKNNLVLTAAIIGALGVIFAALWKSARFVASVYRRFMDFFDDWNGVPAAIGHAPDEATLGIPARMKNMEIRQLKMAEQHENNGGTSLRDAIDRIENISQATQKLLVDHLEDGVDIMEIGMENDKNLYSALGKAGIDVPYHEVQQESMRLTTAKLEEAKRLDGKNKKAKKKLPLDPPEADNS